jgi:DeoR family transcriptional regulator, aga operon transcriptional repressor
MHLHIAIIGVDGVTLDQGLTTHHEIEAHTNRVLLERAGKVVAVADSSKLGLVAFARICPLDAVDELITDTAADPVTIAAIRDAGIMVTTV